MLDVWTTYSAVSQSKCRPLDGQGPKEWFIVSTILMGLIPTLGTRIDAQESTPVYLDARQPIERRVDDLMSRMTLKEKVGQLNLPCVYVDQLG
ncbi:MAG TPA: hypothetical protein VMH03_12145, partial [Terriglobales bacterium]|nr:hypothetical protein [Terriglobales bacterium]